MTESLGVLVRVRAGIDVVSNEATWNLQAIDPETGMYLELSNLRM